MATRKIKDLAVKIGESQDGKARWKNVGALMESDKGQFILLDRTFNPAGVPTEKDSILISAFDPKPKGGGSDDFGGGAPF